MLIIITQQTYSKNILFIIVFFLCFGISFFPSKCFSTLDIRNRKAKVDANIPRQQYMAPKKALNGKDPRMKKLHKTIKKIKTTKQMKLSINVIKFVAFV